jgi:hypothetical protein
MKRMAFTCFAAGGAKTSGRDFGPQKRNGAATNRPKRDSIHFSKNTAELRVHIFYYSILAVGVIISYFNFCNDQRELPGKWSSLFYFGVNFG